MLVHQCRYPLSLPLCSASWKKGWSFTWSMACSMFGIKDLCFELAFSFLFFSFLFFLTAQLEKDVLALQRSTVFATHLQVLSLQYCDLVNDCQLALLSLATRGTVQITNYYGDSVNAMNTIRLLSSP